MYCTVANNSERVLPFPVQSYAREPELSSIAPSAGRSLVAADCLTRPVASDPATRDRRFDVGLYLKVRFNETTMRNTDYCLLEAVSADYERLK